MRPPHRRESSTQLESGNASVADVVEDVEDDLSVGPGDRTRQAVVCGNDTEDVLRLGRHFLTRRVQYMESDG
jgi:hypothetical protein